MVAVLSRLDYNWKLSMSRGIKRVPFGYDGPLPTGRTLKRLLPKIMERIDETQEQRPNVVLEAFQEILGSELSKIAQAKSFHDGVLFVIVKNGTFLSLLLSREKGRILSQLREKCPKHSFNNIVFRVG
jgi:hypothetical protein